MVNRVNWGWALIALSVVGCDDLAAATGGKPGYVATFDDAKGLVTGAQVTIAGVRVGHVKSVALAENKAQVAIEIDDTSTIAIHDDACLTIGWYGARPAHLELDRGTADKPVLPDGGQITCVKTNDLLSKTLSGNLDRTAESTAKVLEHILEGKGTLGRLLRDEKLADRIETFFATPPEAPTATDDAAGGDTPPAATSAAPSAAPPPPPPPPRKGNQSPGF